MECTKHVVKDQRDITIRDLRDRVAELEAWISEIPKLRPLDADEAAYLASCPPDDVEWSKRDRESLKYSWKMDVWSQRRPAQDGGGES